MMAAASGLVSQALSHSLAWEIAVQATNHIARW